MAEEEGVKRVRKPGQDVASGRVHDEEEHAGNLKFEVFHLCIMCNGNIRYYAKLSHTRTHARTNTYTSFNILLSPDIFTFVKYFVVT